MMKLIKIVFGLKKIEIKIVVYFSFHQDVFDFDTLPSILWSFFLNLRLDLHNYAWNSKER